MGLGCLFAGGWVWWAMPPFDSRIDVFLQMGTDLAFLLAVCGFLILGHTWFTHYGEPDLDRDGQRRLRGVGVVAALALAAFLFVNRVAATKTALLEGTRTFWLDDDMMISMRYAWRLAQGGGLVWNLGEPPVEGFTNLLWTLTMAIPHLLGVPSEMASAPILLLNLIGLLGILWLAWSVGRRLGLRPGLRMVGLLLIASNRWILYWAVGGSEAILLGLILMFLADRILAARRAAPLGWIEGGLIGLLALARADGLLLTALLAVIWAALARRGRTRAFAWLPAVILPLALFLWRHSYYGQWLPNTYFLRVVEVPTRVMYGLFHASYFAMLFDGVLVLAVIGMLTARNPRVGWVGCPALALLAYVAYVGGDELAEYRFYVPVVPVLLLLALAGLDRVLGMSRPLRECSPSLRYGFALLLMGLAAVRSIALPGELQKLGEVRGEMERKNVQIGLMLRRHTRPDALVAHYWAGAAPYFSERPALDMLGKNDSHLARLASPPADYQPGHNKYDAEYSFGRRPDVVVAGINARLINDPKAFQEARERQTYPGLFVTLDHPVFQEQYRRNFVATPLSANYHGIFVREGTERANPAARWTESPEKP